MLPLSAAGLAAVLPCFLLYLEMGKCLLAKGEPTRAAAGHPATPAAGPGRLR